MNHLFKKQGVDDNGEGTFEQAVDPKSPANDGGRPKVFVEDLPANLRRLFKEKESFRYSAIAVAVLVVWMASGLVTQSPTTAVTPMSDSAENIAAVAVQEFMANGVTRFISSPAEVKPERAILLRAQTAGRVQSLPVTMGSRVNAGTTIVGIELGDRAARLEGARAELVQRERDNEATEELSAEGFATKARVREVFAALQAARARVKEVEEDVSNTAIKASFGGILDSLDVEVGEYVAVGDEVAKVVDNNPLIVEAQVAQQNVKLLEIGSSAGVSFVTGQERVGTIRFISVQADPNTRTFRVEVEVENSDESIPSGTSAKVNIPLGDVPAHFISPAIFSLDTDGTLGVKSVDENDIVQFHAVDIVRAESDGVWITGLPEQVRIITKGQGFVTAGEAVRPTVLTEIDAPASLEDS